MPTKTEFLLAASPGKNAGIGQDIEDRLPLRRLPKREELYEERLGR